MVINITINPSHRKKDLDQQITCYVIEHNAECCAAELTGGEGGPEGV